MPAQRVGIRVDGREIDGVMHLPDATTIGGAAVLHGFGGDPDQPHIVATCEALANAGVAALRERIPADMSGFAATKDGLRDSLLQQKRFAALSAYMASLRERAQRDGTLEFFGNPLARG